MASNPMIDPPIIWRTKLRSLKPGVDHAKQVAYCIDGGRVGIGWGVEDLPTGTPLADVVAAIRAKKEPGWGPQAASTVRLFGEEAKVNGFIWTRDLEGRFRLAQIASDTSTSFSRALPKARRTDTPAYEWTMLHRETYSPAIVQVKSGAQGVDLEALAAAAPGEQTTLFAYSAAGIYTNSPSRPVTCIETSDLLAFVAEHSKLLPPRVRTWFELAQPAGGESPPGSM